RMLGRRALAVDDNATARRMIMNQLSSLGLVVEGVESGQAALDALEAAEKKGLPYHLVVSDLQMPEMDGLDLIRAMKARPQLRKLGYDVDVVASGRDAVTQATTKDYNAILMDSQMPDLDGFSATREIRALEGDRNHTVIIAMTAGAMAVNREKCLQAGMDDF